MNFDEFVKKYNGQAIDYDGGYGVQCVDLIKLYADKVLGLKFGAFGNAHAYYDNFENIPMLKNNFVKIKNTPEFIPQKGDIIVWNKKRGGGNGHIAVCNGVGTKNYFYSYDMNWNGIKEMQLIKHTYSNVLGAIRFKNQKSNTFKNGDVVEIDLKIGICSQSGDFTQCDNFILRDDRRQFWVHKSVVKDNRLIARATVCDVDSNDILVQVFEGINGRQFWVPTNVVKKL